MHNPTYADYATHDESQFPELWNGTVFAAAPCLGATGLRLFDTSRRNNWATLTNMDPPTDWLISGGQMALDFDGLNDYVTCTQSTQIGTNPFSVCGWIYPTTLTNQRAVFDTLSISGSGGRVNDCVLYVTNTGNLQIYTNNGFGTASTRTVVTNAWNSIALVRSGNIGTYYVNGQQAGTTALATNITGISRNFGVFSDVPGGSSGFNNFQGQMDDFREYNRVIDPAEIRILASRRGIAYQRRKRRYAFSTAPSFLAAWARGSNVLIQPGVA